MTDPISQLVPYQTHRLKMMASETPYPTTRLTLVPPLRPTKSSYRGGQYKSLVSTATQAAALEAQEAKVEDADILAIHDRTMPTAQIMQFVGVGFSFLASAVKPPAPPPDDGRWASILPPPPTEV